MQFTAHEFAKAVLSHAADSYSAGANAGAEIDALGFEEALIILNAGENQATGTNNVKVQECDTSGGTFADITDAAFTEVTTDNDVNIYVGRLELSKRKRYLKVIATVATAACEFGIEVLLLKPKYAPASQVNTLAFSL